MEQAGRPVVERRKKRRPGEHPLASKAKLQLSAPAPERGFAKKPRAAAPEKQRLTLLLDVELIERLRNAVYWTSGLTLAAFVAESLTASLDELETERGEPFPKRRGELPTGRPRK